MPNMNAGITDAEIGQLFAGVDDRASHHVLWVDNHGTVHLDPVPSSGSSERFRLETFVCGNGYVGPEAASDLVYVSKMRRNLETLWRQGARGYIDIFPHAI